VITLTRDKIDELQEKINRMIGSKDVNKDELLKVSQELDEYINEYQEKMLHICKKNNK
jgi:TolA-binding protein